MQSALVSSSQDFGFIHTKLFQTVIDKTQTNIFYHCIIPLPCSLSSKGQSHMISTTRLCLTPTSRWTIPLPRHYFSPYPSGFQHPHNLSPFPRILRPTNPPYTSSPRLIPTHQPTRLHISSGSYYSHPCSPTLFSLLIPSNSTSKTPHPPSTTYTKPSMPSPHLTNLTTTHL